MPACADLVCSADLNFMLVCGSSRRHTQTRKTTTHKRVLTLVALRSNCSHLHKAQTLVVKQTKLHKYYVLQILTGKCKRGQVIHKDEPHTGRSSTAVNDETITTVTT